MDPKLLDNEGKPRINSTWEYVVGATPQNMIYRVREYDGPTAKLSLISNGGKLLNPPDHNHMFTWKRIVAEWKFIANPDADEIPPIIKKTKEGERYEKTMRELEKVGDFASAKRYAKSAAGVAKAELVMADEELAIEEKRVIRIKKLEKLGAGDKASIEVRGLKPFIHYFDQMEGWLWYGK